MFTRSLTILALALSLTLSGSALHASAIDTTPDKKPTLNKKRSTVKGQLNEKLNKQKEKKEVEEKLKADAPSANAASDVYIKIPDIEGDTKPNKAKKELKLKASKIKHNNNNKGAAKSALQKVPTARPKTDNTNSTTGSINTISTIPKCSKESINSTKKQGICKKESSDQD